MHKQVAQKYLDLVTAERVAERLKFLKQIAELTEDAALPKCLQMKMCAIRMHNVICSYFYDKERSIDFHGHTGGPNDAKKLAYMVKWVARIKPFSVELRPGAIDDKNQLYIFQNLINPIFCTVLSIALLKSRYKQSPETEEKFHYALH